MATTTVQRRLRAPIDAVFTQLADHARYAQVPGVALAELTRSGQDDPNGVGAQRHFKLDGAEVWEDIVGFERPTRMEYKIVRMKPNVLRHESGRIVLAAAAGETDVTWTSTFKVTIPLVRRMLEKRIDAQFSDTFNRMLDYVEQQARQAA